MGFPRVAPGSYAGTSRDVGGFVGLGEYDDLGFSLGKVLKNVTKAVGKGVKDVGHAAGKVVTSKAGQLVIGGALAATGVGIPAAAAISAAAQGGGQLIKKGGNLKKAGKGVVVGGAEGAAASLVGKGARKLLHKDAPASVKAAAARETRSGAKGAAVNRIKPDGDNVQVLVDNLPSAAMAKELGPPPVPVAPLPLSATDQASKVLGMGAKANRGAKQAAAKARNAGSTADKIAAALAKAREAGDAVGATGLTEKLAQAQQIAENASGAAERAARQAEQIGAAAQAAAAGAVGEGAAQGFGDFIKSPVGIVTSVAAIGGGLYLMTRGGGRSLPARS
jgi:hypothetical protein